MSPYTQRALRAIVAAAAIAALGMSFVGTATAATPHNDATDTATDTAGSAQHSATDAGHARGKKSPEAPALTDGPPGIHNDLVNLEVPKVKTSAYHTALPGVPASHHEDSDDDDNDQDAFCPGGDFNLNLPDNVKYQHPCDAHGNSYGKGDVQYPHSLPSHLPV
jgi:hypothetical protein